MGTVATQNRPLAMVTGASTGIGYELARCCVENGYDLVIAADEPAIQDAAARLHRAARACWPSRPIWPRPTAARS